MDAPCPIMTPEKPNIQKFVVKINEEDYILLLDDDSNIINLSINEIEKDNYSEYGESYSLEQLIEINNIFKMFDSIKNVRNSVEDILKAQKYSLEKNNENNIIFTLKISAFEKLIDVSLLLKKKKMNQTNLIDIMRHQIKDLNNKIKNLNNKHKEDIEHLNKEMNELKEKYNKLQDTNERLIILYEEIKSKLNKTDKDVFEFCFREGVNYTLSSGGKIAEKTNGDNGWNCTIIGDKEIPKNVQCKWRIRLNKFKITKNAINILIGVGPNNEKNKEYFYQCCWTLSCGTSKFINNFAKIGYNNYPGNLKEGDIIEVIINREVGELSFKINDIDYGIACSNIPNEDILYPIVLIHDMNQIVEILD